MPSLADFYPKTSELVPETPLAESKVDHGRVCELIRELLIATGHDPDDPGIADTPRRVADLWRSFLDYDPGTLDTAFEAVKGDQMVVVKGMRVWSMCEHHLLPFWCDVSVGYIAKDKVLGLSKLGRIAHKYAHRLQLQERLVEAIAQEIVELAGTRNVAVVAEGEHLCMTMRGIRTPHRMVSSAVRGTFLEDPAARSEFLRLAGH